jgi:hypothetical protein
VSHRGTTSLRPTGRARRRVWYPCHLWFHTQKGFRSGGRIPLPTPYPPSSSPQRLHRTTGTSGATPPSRPRAKHDGTGLDAPCGCGTAGAVWHPFVYNSRCPPRPPAGAPLPVDRLPPPDPIFEGKYRRLAEFAFDKHGPHLAAPSFQMFYIYFKLFYTYTLLRFVMFNLCNISLLAGQPPFKRLLWELCGPVPPCFPGDSRRCRFAWEPRENFPHGRRDLVWV